jgi:FlaG/FlaF family flagellin (archaellin)
VARASTSVVAVVLLLAVTALGAAALGQAVSVSVADPPPRATFALAADAGADTVTIRHVAGAAIPVERLRVRLAVGGEALAHQPPVPYFAAPGFAGTPTGPANVGHDGPWAAGEAATLALASTNEPLPDRGDVVTARLSTPRGVIARLETRAG